MENWIRYLIYMKQLNRKEVITNFVKPCIKELDKMVLIETFHFFFYGDKDHPIPYLDLRIKPKTEEDTNKIKEILGNTHNKINELNAKEPEFKNDYSGEIENYGQEGWEIAKKLFEYGSRYAITHFTIGDKDRPKDLQFEKFVHCFMNPLFGYEGELNFCISWLLGLKDYFMKKENKLLLLDFDIKGAAFHNINK